MKRKDRNWVPLYISGRGNFQKPVMEALEQSVLPFLPGYLFDNSLSGSYGMVWRDEHTNLRKFKEAIGSKLIWKHRLRFFTDLNEFNDALKFQHEAADEFGTAA